MYIVAIGWIYVVLMMSVTETSAIAGVMTFLLYGILPLTVILYLLNTPKRRQRRAEEEFLRRRQIAAAAANEPEQEVSAPDS